MLRIGNHILHAAMFAMVAALGSYDLSEVAILAGWSVISWLASHFALRTVKSQRAPEIGALCLGIVALFWGAYVTKLALATVWSEQYWVVHLIVSEHAMLRKMPEAFGISTLGYCAILAAVLSFPLRAGFRWEVSPFRPRTGLLGLLLPALLAGKYILKQEFHLGIPGLDPAYLGVPYLAGLVTFVIDTGFVFTANVVLFLGLMLGRPGLMLYGMLIAFANAGIDLRFGSKDTVIYQLAIATAYLVLARRSRAASAERRHRTAMLAIVLLAVAGIGVVGAYKFFNFFRFALLTGADVDLLAAVQAAVSSETAAARNSLMEIYNRITGLETVAALLSVRDELGIRGTLLEMIDGSIVQKFTYYIMGTSDAKTLFAVTQFGYFYLSGGLLGLLLGSFVQGFFFCVVQWTVLRMRVERALTVAFLPVLWVLFIKSLLGGGDMTLWLKEVAVLIATFWMTVCFASGPAHARARPRSAHALPGPLSRPCPPSPALPVTALLPHQSIGRI